MTLRRKMTLQLGTMLVGLLLVIATGLWGLNGQQVDFNIASKGYRQLRSVYEVAGRAATAKILVRSGNVEAAANEIDGAAAQLDLFASEEQAAADASTLAFTQSLHTTLAQAAALLRPKDSGQVTIRQQFDALDRVLGQVTGFAMGLRRSISDHETAAHHRWKVTLVLLLAVSLVVTVVAVWLATRQYWSVLGPLQRLRQVADRFASGQLGERLDVQLLSRGGTEFGRLADDFNRMARDLQSLYDNLEQQVQTKSRELVRSERLASVGYLAAGIAHEINNPLGIITGYAERTSRQLSHDVANDAVLATAMRNLSVICDEAYRCKAITERLLSLVRPGEEQHNPVELNALVAEVAELVQGLPLWQRQKVQLQIEASPRAVTVSGAAAELKQVLLNVLINAAEAEAQLVRVRVEVDGTSALIIVSDDGRGMDASTLQHIFEPFFTEKRGAGSRNGTGLGLSISHAIIENHGGRMRASSAGIGHGCEFVVDLPLIGAASTIAAAEPHIV